MRGAEVLLASGLRTTSVHRFGTVQGKPAARRGRKARDLRSSRDRPAAGTAAQHNDEVSREGEPGALHNGDRASCDDCHEPGRRDALVVMTMTMYRLVLASVKTSGHNDPAFGPIAGHQLIHPGTSDPVGGCYVRGAPPLDDDSSDDQTSFRHHRTSDHTTPAHGGWCPP